MPRNSPGVCVDCGEAADVLVLEPATRWWRGVPMDAEREVPLCRDCRLSHDGPVVRTIVEEAR